jgi:large subunit ribosomal protein L25
MDLVLTAEPHRTTGTRPARRLRREGRIPAVVYGLGNAPVSVSVDWRELRQCLKTDAGVNAVIHLAIDGKRHLSIVKDLQRHPVRRDVIHVDFLRVDPKQAITFEVPVVLEGEAKQVTAMDGIVEQLLFKVSVEARPDAIPNEVTLDISGLELGQVITVGQIVLPQGATMITDPDAAVVHGAHTRATMLPEEEAEAEGAEAETDKAEQPEASGQEE